MAITRQFLEQQITDMETQVSVFTGAIQFARMLLAEMDKDMSVQEFAELVAGPGATADIIEKET
jgi:hypothetical protein